VAAVTLEGLVAQRDDLKSEVMELENTSGGARFSQEDQTRWNDLNAQIDDLEIHIDELQKRQSRLNELAAEAEPSEDGTRDEPAPRLERAVPRWQRTDRVENIFDLSTIRRDYNDPEVEKRVLVDRARKAVEMADYFHTDKAEAVSKVERLLRGTNRDCNTGEVAKRILMTGGPTYKRAFGKAIVGNPLTNEESRALSLTGSAGGFAVPFELDPTVIPTSNLAVNPFRAIARVEQITVDEFRGVSSAGVTVAYAAEATATADNAPTLSQPTISTEKAQAFIPFSIEVGMDWDGLQAEMGRLLQDGKDELEATKFAVGSGTNEPQGVITGATTVFTASGTASFAVADLYGLEAALGPRFRPRAAIVMNRAIATRIRQFDTAGGANLWIDTLKDGLANEVPTPGAYRANLLGYPAFEASAMASVLTTGSLIAILGDFSYYIIVDRIGLNVELIPHLFDVTNNRPTGQRGLYAYFRNGAGVVSANAFRVLKTG
jgi:HK97 family phage major capsid protein